MNCNHELFTTEEKTISEDEIEVTMKCSMCENKFIGVLKRDGRKRV